jgi:hypothetical protein
MGLSNRGLPRMSEVLVLSPAPRKTKTKPSSGSPLLPKCHLQLTPGWPLLPASTCLFPLSPLSLATHWIISCQICHVTSCGRIFVHAIPSVCNAFPFLPHLVNVHSLSYLSSCIPSPTLPTPLVVVTFQAYKFLLCWPRWGQLIIIFALAQVFSNLFCDL